MRSLSEEQQKSIQRGDVILYHFGFTTTEAVVTQAFEGGYLKVRHKDFPILNCVLGYKDVIRTSEVLAVVKKKNEDAKKEDE
ncbi:hypothetical protein R7M47_05275 [Bacillus inaquosorum]|uniref:hypothetical protein n=1 Tax=Bacillus inaquosorum TaxID=483913 RepID=UPI00389AD87E